MSGIVPRGTIAALVEDEDSVVEKLQIYEAEIRRWNPNINLISPKTVEELWQRHFVDSLQLLPLVPRGTKTALDIGSGGGFPALVLAAADDNVKWTLVESDQRKSVFLRHVARAMAIDVEVKSERIEKLAMQNFDLISARALAELDQLLTWTHKFAQESTTYLFPKGKNWRNELTSAQRNWQMKSEDFASQTDAEARILRLSQVKRR